MIGVDYPQAFSRLHFLLRRPVYSALSWTEIGWKASYLRTNLPLKRASAR